MKKPDHVPQMVFAVLLGLSSSLVQAVSPTDPIQEHEKEALFPARSVIDFGRDVAETACANCHGMDGISDTPGEPHLAGQRAIYLYRVQQAYQAGTRTDENNNHKAFLTDKSLLAVSSYYSSLSPAPNLEALVAGGQADASEEDPFLGIRDSMKKCIKCHGETGNAEGSGMPNLTAQDPEYFVTSMNAYIDGSRKHNLMKRLVGALDEETIKEMGVYYAVQEPVRTETQGDGDASVGERIAEDCESCHGDDGNSKKAKMPTLAGQNAKYFIKAMKHYKDGKRRHQKMFEAVEQLSEQEIADLATYYATQQPLKRNVRAPLKSGEWITRCERCHGVGGNSSDARFPMLAGQDKDYLFNALKGSTEEGIANSTMHRMADSLSSRDIERLATYFSSQQPKAVVYIQVPCGDDK